MPGPWTFVEVNDEVVHFVPVDDLVEHDTATTSADCVCGPTREIVDYGPASHGLVVTHYSLDGREAHE